MSTSKRGGAGRGQGRKPTLPQGEQVIVSIRMTKAQRDKMHRLGGSAWVRKRIDEAAE